MSSYVSEQNKWEEFKKKKAGTQAQKQGNTASNSSSEQEKWEAFKKQKASGIDSSYISSFLNDSQKFIQDRSSGFNQWFDTSADTWDADSSDYSNRSRRIRAYLRTSSNPYDEETTANLNADLDAFDENLKSLGSSHRKAVELYSQFDSQESYNAYLQGLKDKQAMLELDTKAAQADLENLQKNVAEFTELNTWYNTYRSDKDNENVTDPRIRQMLDRRSELQDWFAAEYGGTDNLKNIVSEKSAYLNTAKRLQGNAAFTTVSDPTSEYYDPEFQNYTAPKVTLPTREELAAYDTMMDQSQWRAGTNEDLYDAYGNAIDPYNKDANGNIIHPMQGTVDASDKLGIFRAATEEEISEATGTYLSTGGTWENILAEGSQRYWNRMTDDEINTYYYHLNKGGAEAAAQYLDTIQETLNYREGRARYEEIQGQTGKEILYAIAAGLGQSAITAGGSRNTGSAGSKYIPASAVQVTGQLAREGLADDSIPMWYNFKEGKWEDKIFGSSAGQMAYDLLSTTANMAPSILVSTAVGMLNPTAGQIAGAAVMGIGAGGNAYQEKINAGYTEEEARSYGLMVGASETVLEYALGGIGKLGKNVLTKTVLKNLDAVDNVFARFAKSAGGKILLNASSEAIEEGLQSVIEPYLWQAVSGEEATVDMQEALYNALMGFATGGLFESTEAVNSGINQQIQYQDMGSQLIRDGGVDPLKELANEMYGVTEGKTQRQLGRQLAKVEKNATPSRVGKLSSTVQENLPAYQKTRAEQTRAALVENMTQKGVDTTRAETVADAIAAAQAGEDLSREQVDTLLSLGEADEREIAAIEEVADLLTQAEELEDIPSADGKVLYRDNPVELAGISSAGDGKLILNLEDGGTADVSELSFPDTGEKELYEAIARYADSAASAEQLLENYRSGDVPAQIYARGIAEAYQYGRMQYTAPQLMQDGVLVQQLHANQTSYAYGLGKASIQRDTARRQQEAARKSAPRKGSVNYGYKGEKVDKSRLNEAQKVVVDFAERLADMKGMTFYFYRSHENADGQWVYKNAAGQEVLAGNGYYDPRDGSIHIDLNAGDEGSAMLSTIAHELTHFIQDWSPEKYRTFCRILMEGYADRGQSVRELVLKKQDEYLRIFGIDLTYEQAYDEVIASSMESVLNDGNVMDLLDQLETADKSLWEKFCSFLEEIADLIHRTVQAFRNVHPESDEGRIVERMTEIHAQLQRAFAEGLHEGGENYRTGGKENTAQTDGVKFAVRESFQHELQDWFDSTTHEERKTSGKRFLVGETTDVLKGIGVQDYRIYFGGSKIDKILTNNTSMSLDTIKAAVMLLEDPILIMESLTVENSIVIFGEVYTNGNKPVMISVLLKPETKSGDILNYAVITSAYGRGKNNLQNLINRSKIYYVNEQKNRTDKWLKALGLQLPSAITKYGSINSIRNPGDSVKKNSARYQQNESAAQLLQQENDRMVEDVAALTPLTQALRKMNGGKMRTAYLAEAVAFLKSKAGAKGNSAELGSLLSDFYSYMTHNDDYTWEDIRQKAKPVAAWLMDHTVRTKQMSSYARDILDFLRTSRISLDDTQKAEAAYHYGSYDAYRRMLMGSVIVANENAVPLDSKWQELSQLYPDVFPEDTNAADMPEAFLDAIQQLRNSDTSELEYEYNRDFIEQDLILRIYDSFWNASTLNVAADYFGQKIRSMKEKHNRNMSLAYQRHRDAQETQRQNYRRQLESLQAHQEERYQRREAEYKESRQKAVERHDKAQMRKRIRKEVESLRRLNERAPKDQRTKEELQAFAQTALKAADAVFLENYNEYNMIRNGVGVELLPEEAELLKECRELLDKLGEVAPVEDKWDLEDSLRFAKENEAIKQELFKKIKPLRDAGIFRREFNRIHNVDVAQLIDELTASYAQLKTTESEYLSGAYQEEVYTQLQNVKESIGAKSVKDMTMQELQQLYEMYHMVLHVIRTANETFAGERAKSVTALGNGVVRELEGRRKQLTSRKIIEDLKKTGWNGLTVAYAFRTIGSDTMQQLYKNLRNGEDVWARDMQEAKDFWQKQADRFKAHDWDMDKRQKFHDSRGNEFSVSLGQLMSLYALSKRQQAWDHLEVGGFMLDNSEHYITNIVDRALPKMSTTAQTYKLTRKDLDAVCSKLTPQQRAFVDATQAYLSTDLAAKGNEVSMKLYGIKLFKEKNYFPLRTASQGRYQPTEVVDQNKLKNSGFTKEIKPKAGNSVVLSSYSSVWTNHVNQMGLYHGLTLPMEDMDRVLNFGKTIQKDENGNEAEVFEQDSVCTTMQNIFGQHPENYIRELMKQLNGGVRSDDTEQLSTRMLGRFKKAAVAASLSVWIQQWTSMFRAMAYIDPRFFAQMPQLGKQRQAQVDDMKAHCPVAIIKEMGGFDTGMGASVHDFITGRETHNLKEYGRELLKHPIKQMDELSGWLPQRADENTWVRIWIAAKRETLDKHKDLRPGSEEFYKLASDRFNEVITLTQVYDSVMAKSALMRSKGFGAKMLTQFMAEPTIASNMAWDAGVQMVRTGKPQVRTAAALVSSIVVNAMCSSLIYAMRDDDEEETFTEKYAQSFVSNLADGLNPLTYIPIVRDIWSVFQGYDVGRSDMELWSGLSSSLQKLTKKYADENATEKELRDAWWSLADNVFSLFGIPEKNVRREINAGINVFQTLRKDFSGRTTTGGSMADTAQDAFLSSVPIVGWIKGETKAEKLLDASIAGDAKYVARLRSTYKTKSAANNAVAGAVRDRFEAGELTKTQAVKQLTAYAGKSKEEAEDKLVYWQFQLDCPEIFKKYKELCEGKTKREEILPIIDSLPLTVEQKDVLYFAEGYAESTLDEAPWH